MNVRAAVVVLLALSAGAVRAQQPAPAGPPSSVASPPSAPLPALTERLNVIVEGADGRLVSGLRASDFILRVDGQPQRIENVAARAPAPRVIAVLLDEFHVRADATAAVREAVHRFVEQQLRPDDRVVILKPLDSLPEIHLTADRERLHAAIDSFEGRKGNYEPRTPLEEQTVGRAPALAEAARAQIVLSGLRALASRLGTQPGRAGIVLVSEGFVRDARLMNARALPDVSVVERFANRFDVPVFAIDPAPAALDDPAEATLARLANQTGAFLDHGPDLGAAMQRAAAGLDAGYVITFAPPHGADGRFHTVTVDTTRKKGTARTRAGYIAPQPPNAYRAIARDTAEPFTTRLQHRSRFIDVWSGVTRFANAEGQIVVTWEPASLFGTVASTATRVSLLATEPNGRVLFQGVLSPVRTAPLEGSGVVNRAEFTAPAGRVFLDMTILGSRGEKLDIDARDLEVPAAGPTVQLLPPVILAARSALEFREAQANQDAAPDPGRAFSRTTRLLIRVPSYGGTGTTRVAAQLLNRSGQTLRTIDAVPGGAEGVSQFDLPLAPFAPGDYVLLLIASGDRSSVEQRVPIRVTG